MARGPSQPSREERDLVIRARAGDAQAAGELFVRFWRAARAAAYAVVRDLANAEDAAAEAFRVALPRLDRLRDPDRFGPWLRRIVRRVASRESARNRSDSGSLEQVPPATTPDPARSLELREMALLVSQAVERLPAAEREAVILYYFEGYAGDDAARFLDIPVGTLRRRLHDRRIRLRRQLTRTLETRKDDSDAHAQLPTRVRTLLSTDAPQSQWYDVTRELLLTRPIPFRLLTDLASKVSVSKAHGDFVNRVLTRPQGPLLEDSGPSGEAARALRAALGNCEDWVMDSSSAARALPDLLRRDTAGRLVGMAAGVMPPALLSGRPGRYVRVTRGLLFDDDAAGVMDPAELFVRSESLGMMTEGTRRARLSDVLDVHWVERRPMELSEVEIWVTGIADQLIPRAETRCSAQVGLRYRSALRLTFHGDARPAAIGGVLAAWPGAPEGTHVVHVRFYVEVWAQMRSGRPVPTQEFPLPAPRPEQTTKGRRRPSPSRSRDAY
jgi:RNA polymerase sigma factor (sigma-70 family)